MSQANVRSVDAIKDFKVSLINFSEDARNALGGVEMEIRQVRNWLERDQLAYWKAQVKRCNELVSEARTELHRRKLSQGNSDAVSDADQKEALRMAQRRLHEAEEKVERIKRWVPILEHATSEYHSQSQPLGDSLSGKLVGSLALLERMIVAVEQYLAMDAPASAPFTMGGSAASEAGPRTSTSAANGTAPEASAETAAPAASTEAASAAVEGSGSGAAANEGSHGAAADADRASPAHSS